MVDSAYGSDDKVTNWVPNQAKAYLQAALQTQKQPGVESWLMTHRPIFGRQAGNGFAPNFTPCPMTRRLPRRTCWATTR